MSTFFKELTVETVEGRPSYHMITNDVKKAVKIVG